MDKSSSSNEKGHKFGSEVLDSMVDRLKSTQDPRKRYEFVIWLGKKLTPMPPELQSKELKVKGCMSEVYVLGELVQGQIQWQGYSDALITKGLLALLIQGLNGLTPEQVLAVDQSFIAETGLQASLTPSRANGFLNILLSMKSQAQNLLLATTLTSS